MAPMRAVRQAAMAVSVGPFVYVCGGASGTRYLSSMERFEDEPTW